MNRRRPLFGSSFCVFTTHTGGDRARPVPLASRRSRMGCGRTESQQPTHSRQEDKEMKEKSMLTKVKWLALALALMAAVGAGATAKWSRVGAQASEESPGPRECKSEYSERTLAGCFGWQSTAYVHGVTTDASAAIGLIHFDGAGNLNGWYSGDYMGSPTARNYAGWYTVNPNGTGHLHWVDDHHSTIDCDLVVVGGGNEIFCSNIDPGYIHNIDFKRQ